MTAVMESTNPDHEQWLARLEADAEYFQPRLFAVYGIYKAISSTFPEQPFLGWGVDFGDNNGALFWRPDESSTHHSDSAARVLQFYQRIGDARLKWLDE